MMDMELCPDCEQPMGLRGQWGWICFKCREQFDNWYESQLTDDQSKRIQSNWESSKAFVIWTQDKWLDDAHERMENDEPNY